MCLFIPLASILVFIYDECDECQYNTTNTIDRFRQDVNDEQPAFVYRNCPLISTAPGRQVCETPTFTATVLEHWHLQPIEIIKQKQNKT
jgi:hypothetical protein